MKPPVDAPASRHAPARHVQRGERLQRTGELDPAPRGVAHHAVIDGQPERGVVGHLRRRLGRNDATNLDPTGADQLGGLQPRASQTTPDELGVQTAELARHSTSQ